jgi:hypothetical protein
MSQICVNDLEVGKDTGTVSLLCRCIRQRVKQISLATEPASVSPPCR